MKIIIVGVLLASVSVPAWASDYDGHMHAGESLEGKQQWRDALREYEAALVAKTGDAHALTEIGWAAYNAGNLARAKQASAAAVVAAAEDSELRGAALYNLGLAIESEDSYTAASVMLAGYALRPNATVEKHIERVEAKIKTRAPGADKDLLAQLHVDALPLPDPVARFHSPDDDVLVATLSKAGASFSPVGMMKEVFSVDSLTCSESSAHAFECTATGTDPNTGAPGPALRLTGDQARALVLGLKTRKIAAAAQAGRTVYIGHFRCTQYDKPDTRGSADLSCQFDR